MDQDELKKLQVHKSVDARGTACPGPLLAAKKAMGEINPGEVLEILSSDQGTKRDVPKWAQKKGHEYLGTVEESGYFTIYMKKR
ncbi:MAG TPA: sulfurtransferase TusA family protein [Candidatus Eisenbacteria bacterium]|uniref:Sulfurtransferase TusA family protein n=1 Tax=Eiseniibacteriota bacterium TaxID=2212470 RepID=A0A7V2F439_UNCEI|nr:sulfurtransferase TusA family protein [Candidatus Eisenbacteria bacterium]